MPLINGLSLLNDPRLTGHARRHDLKEILAMAISAVPCDMNTFEEVAIWAESKGA